MNESLTIPSSSVQIHPLIQKRRSTRAYAEREVDTEILLRLFEAARWAPSSVNEQPWRFLLAQKSKGEAYEKIFSAVNPSNQVWAEKAPVLVAVMAKTTFSKNGRSNAHAWHDTGLAVAMLSIQATQEDLFVHQLGGFNSEMLRNNLEIPDDFEPVSVLVIGYKGDIRDLPEAVRVKEEYPRTRKPLNEILFKESWEEKV